MRFLPLLLVAALFQTPSADALAASGTFVGTGLATARYNASVDCPETPVRLVIRQVEPSGFYAHLSFLPACSSSTYPYALPFQQAGTVFGLSGSWQEGFVGYGFLISEIVITPSGNGYAFAGCLLCHGSFGDLQFRGRVATLAFVP